MHGVKLIDVDKGALGLTKNSCGYICDMICYVIDSIIGVVEEM